MYVYCAALQPSVRNGQLTPPTPLDTNTIAESVSMQFCATSPMFRSTTEYQMFLSLDVLRYCCIRLAALADLQAHAHADLESHDHSLVRTWQAQRRHYLKNAL